MKTVKNSKIAKSAENTKTPKVIIYSTPTCTYCELAKEFFNKNNVEYEEFDVAEDLERRAEMVEKTGQLGVPVFVIPKKSGGEEVIVGFYEDKVKAALGL